MENGNFCLIWNYNLLVVRKFFEVTLVRRFIKTLQNIRYLFSEILQIWTDIKYEANIYSIEQLKPQNVWQNSLIRVGNKPIHYKSWSSKGVRSVGHLMKDSMHFYPLRILQNVLISKQTFLPSKG